MSNVPRYNDSDVVVRREAYEAADRKRDKAAAQAEVDRAKAKRAKKDAAKQAEREVLDKTKKDREAAKAKVAEKQKHPEG